jgi:ADP-ribose pyrophosphatase
MKQKHRHSIIASENIFKGFFDVDKITFSKEEEGSEPLTREVVHPKKAAAVLIHNTQSDSIVFSNQFRVAAMAENEGWVMEIPAGVLDEGENPEDTAKRECMEETGYEVKSLELITHYFTSPGYTSERIALYYAEVESDDKTGDGGGKSDENEEIIISEVPFADCISMIQDGRISDGKSVLALLWLLARKNSQI